MSSDNLSWTRTLLDSHHASFKLVVDPKGADAGVYRGTLEIVGDNVKAAPVQLSVALSQHSDRVRAVLFLLIVLAALAGLGVKWLAGAGTKLQRVQQRLNDLRQRIAAAPYQRTAFPSLYLATLVEVDQLISDRDATAADARLTEIETGYPKVVAVARWFAWLQGVVSTSSAAIDGDPRLAADAGSLKVTLTQADTEGTTLKEDSWPSPDDQATARGAFAPLGSYVPFINVFAVADAKARNADPLRKALLLYQTGQYAEALKAWAAGQPIAQQAVQSDLAHAGIELRNLDGEIQIDDGGGGPPARRRRSFVGWLIDHAALLAATAAGVLAAAVIIANVGPTFHGLGDFAKFIAAGFGAGLTGATLSDFAAKKTTA